MTGLTRRSGEVAGAPAGVFGVGLKCALRALTSRRGAPVVAPLRQHQTRSTEPDWLPTGPRAYRPGTHRQGTASLGFAALDREPPPARLYGACRHGQAAPTAMRGRREIEVQEPKKRGVRLGDLDRSRRYVIGHTGRRWEVIEDAGPAAGAPPPGAGGPRQAEPRGEPAVGRHAAPDRRGDSSPDPWDPT